MTSLPKPPDVPGVTWRPATRNDAAGIAEHSRRIHEVERLHYVLGEESMGWVMDQPGTDPTSDMFVAESDGAIVADAGVWTHGGDSGARCFIWAEASPGHEALKPFLIEWAEARARQRLAAYSGDLERVIRLAAEEHRHEHRQAIVEAGFDHTRTFAEMVRPLTNLPDPTPLPSDIEVELWSPEIDDAVRLANNESFADHWGSLPMSVDEWVGHYQESPTFRPELSFAALDDKEVVSFSLCEVDEEDNADRATNDVYVQRVGTLRSHRGRGLASHLIVRSLEAAQARGDLDRAALDVDETSHTKATLVYERLGFATTARSLQYTKHL